jgi:hypothetical protein
LNFKGAYGGAQTLTICRYLPISLRFHSLSSRAKSNGLDAFTGSPRHLRVPADRLIVEFFGLARLVSGPGLAVVTATAPSNPRG